MSLSIRFARPHDAELIHRFIRELAEYEREPDAVRVTVDVLQRQLSSPRPPFECLIAEINDETAGFALFYSTYSTWTGQGGIGLEDLYVSPRFRGVGIGRELFRALCQVADERGYARVDWMVLNWNEAALHFYRELGGTHLSDWQHWRLNAEQIAELAARAGAPSFDMTSDPACASAVGDADAPVDADAITVAQLHGVLREAGYRRSSSRKSILGQLRIDKKH